MQKWLTQSAMRGKTTCVALISCLLFSGAPRAQPTSPAKDGNSSDPSPTAADEVIVRGKRLSDIASALEVARVHVYDVFNDLNSDDAFDVHCEREASTGSRIKRDVCRPRFKADISNAAAKAWTDALKWVCTGGVSQDCIFSPYASSAISAAQGEESREGGMQRQFALEMARVVAESPELRKAIVEYQAIERAYREAHRAQHPARGCARSDPPRRCSH